jgi:hypothetical protein
MAKDTYYFQHDFSPLDDPKLLALVGECGAAGYGIYWRIVEMLHSEDEHKLRHEKYIMLALAKQMGTSVEQIEQVLNTAINVCKLFDSDGEFFWSERVFRNVGKMEALAEKRRKAGIASAKARKTGKTGTGVEHVLTSVQQNPTKENKIKENKRNINTDIKEKNIKKKNDFDFKSELRKIGISDGTAEQWLKVRKAKKAVNTEIAFKMIAIEMGKVPGATTEEMAQVAVSRSWTGFRAEWYENAIDTQDCKNKGHPAGKEDNITQMMRQAGIYADYHKKNNF